MKRIRAKLELGSVRESGCLETRSARLGTFRTETTCEKLVGYRAQSRWTAGSRETLSGVTRVGTNVNVRRVRLTRVREIVNPVRLLDRTPLASGKVCGPHVPGIVDTVGAAIAHE